MLVQLFSNFYARSVCPQRRRVTPSSGTQTTKKCNIVLMSGLKKNRIFSDEPAVKIKTDVSPTPSYKSCTRVDGMPALSFYGAMVGNV